VPGSGSYKDIVSDRGTFTTIVRGSSIDPNSGVQEKSLVGLYPGIVPEGMGYMTGAEEGHLGIVPRYSTDYNGGVRETSKEGIYADILSKEEWGRRA
jgi:hypothetical protein